MPRRPPQTDTPLRRSCEAPEAFEAFYRSTAEGLLRFFARRTLDAHLALELTAETFAVAFTKRAQFRGGTDQEAEAWLYGIARSELAAFHRRGAVRARALRRLQIQTPRYTEADLARVDDLASITAMRSDAARQFAALPTRLRDAVELRVIEELSYPEVAERLGISEQTARARVSRGLKVLRATVKPTPKEAPA